MKLTPIICKALFAVLLVSGCDTRIAPSTTQQLSIRSGDFGIVDEAVIISIDFIRFDRPRTRYANSISELALAWLNRADPDVSRYSESFVESATTQLTDEIEAEIRSRNCIYVVRPSSKNITSAIVEDVQRRTGTIEDELLDLATEDELEYLRSLDDDAFEIEFDRLIEKYTPEYNETTDEIIEFAVASQCILDMQVGDSVTIVKFDDLISISPPLSEDSYVDR